MLVVTARTHLDDRRDRGRLASDTRWPPRVALHPRPGGDTFHPPATPTPIACTSYTCVGINRLVSAQYDGLEAAVRVIVWCYRCLRFRPGEMGKLVCNECRRVDQRDACSA